MVDKPEPICWGQLAKNRRAELLALAERIAKRESKRMHEVYGDDVLGIGVGFRRKGKAQRTYRELVIRVSVAAKWPGETGPSRAIPPYFSTTVTRGGRREEVRIPTDVSEMGELELQRTRVNIHLSGAPAKGSICCLLRDRESGDVFLLSCKHVFGLADQTSLCVGTKDGRIDLRDPDHTFVAHVARDGDLATIFPDTPDGLLSLDAAVARVDDTDAVSSKINNRIAQRIFGGVEVGMKVSIPAQSRALRGTIEAVWRDSWVQFPCDSHRHWLLFPTVIEYRTEGKQTEGGDSGSPLLLSDGSLVGMHFALNNGRGLAMLVEDIVQWSTFGRDLELVSDHRV